MPQIRILGKPGVAYTLTTARDRMDMIGRVRWASDLNWSELVRVAQFFDACHVEAGATVFREGDHEAYMCLVVEGQVDIIKTTRSDHEQVITSIGPGGTFGEMSLIDGEPRSATVRVSESAQLLILSQESFARLAEECPRLILRMVLRLTRSLSQRLRETSGELVEFLDE